MKGAEPDRDPVVRYIVGIGASAGGLEAFERFFTHLSPTTGMGFVLVQHLEPTHKGIDCQSSSRGIPRCKSSK